MSVAREHEFYTIDSSGVLRWKRNSNSFTYELSNLGIKSINWKNKPRLYGGEIDLENNKLESFSWKGVPKNVKFIYVSDNKLKSFSWKGVPRKLESLYIQGNSFETFKFENIPKTENLFHISVGNENITHFDFENLPSNIRSLDIRWSNLKRFDWKLQSPDMKNRNNLTIWFPKNTKIYNNDKKHKNIRVFGGDNKKSKSKSKNNSRTKSNKSVPENFKPKSFQIISFTKENDPILNEKVQKRDTISLRTDGRQWTFETVSLAKWIQINPTNPMTRTKFSDNQINRVNLKASKVLNRKQRLSSIERELKRSLSKQ